jgi:hypothetical protein
MEVSEEAHDWLRLLFASMPKDINRNEQDASDNNVYRPLPAHFHNPLLIISDKIADIGQYPYP